MAKFDAAGSRLILPDGGEIAPDAKGVDLSADTLKNEGVQAWIEDGQLVEVEAKAKASGKSGK